MTSSIELVRSFCHRIFERYSSAEYQVWIQKVFCHKISTFLNKVFIAAFDLSCTNAKSMEQSACLETDGRSAGINFLAFYGIQMLRFSRVCNERRCSPDILL